VKLKIDLLDKNKFKADIRGHEIIADLPVEKGGGDTAPTPTEIFIFSLGSCAVLFASRYLETAGLNAEGLSLDIDWEYARDPSRVGKIDMEVTVLNAELGARRKALLKAIDKCVVHKTLKVQPEINIEIKQ